MGKPKILKKDEISTLVSKPKEKNSQNSEVTLQDMSSKSYDSNIVVESTKKQKRDNMEPTPSTSQGITHKIQNEEIDLEPPSKKSRVEYNFWVATGNETIEETTVDSTVKYINIAQLEIGKVLGLHLKFRVTYISEVRKTKKVDVIDFHIMDDSGEISCINFGNKCEKIYDLLKVNALYCLSHFYVNKEKDQYPSGLSRSLQIQLFNDSVLEPIADDDAFAPIVFNFVSLIDIQDIDKNERAEVLGVLVKNFGLEKNWKGTPVRELALTNERKEMLIITLWGKQAENFLAEMFSIIAIRRAIVTEYEGKKKLNCISGTLVWVCRNIPEAFTLFNLFQDMKLNSEIEM